MRKTPPPLERELWNAKYRTGSHTSLRPDPLLLQADRDYVRPLLPARGAVLDVAGGAGRHALFYAKQGWKASLVDVSEVGIALARKNARRKKLAIETIVADLNSYDLQELPRRFDLVLVFFYLQRKLFPALVEILKPGGLLIYKTYLRGTLKGPTHPLHLLQPNELLTALRTLRVLHYRETVGESRTAEFVGRKE
ncbi:MAG TPA: class I SAM-dependent methyltransferase [Terriglobales bacterium]|jgi:tellurite methyltransferase|nr:class I SAM-dependent methyltransferase [Terriglobales bacterium]